MDEARRALAHWPAFRSAVPVPLGSAGGFSGARLWRVATPPGVFCLKASPPGGRPERFAWMRLAATLPFVPALAGPPAEIGGRVWELQTWMPGRADYREGPSVARLRAACVALRRLHEAWRAEAGPETGEIPAVSRRLEALAGPTPDAGLRRLAEVARQELSAWRGSERLRPCLCDVWHDHVLFTGDEVTGVVDYASMRMDAPAVDLARLLGSLVGDDDDGWRVGLDAYGADESTGSLARLLDRAGAVAAAMRWERWLREGRSFADPAAARRRADDVLRRVRGS